MHKKPLMKPQVMGKMTINNKYFSFYFSVYQICQLSLDKANDDDVFHTNRDRLYDKHRRRWRPQTLLSNYIKKSFSASILFASHSASTKDDG